MRPKTRDRSPSPQSGNDFEEHLRALKESLHKLEQGELSLDESVAEYEQGLKMLKSCHGFLNEAERKIELLTRNTDGETELKDFQHEAWRPEADD